jgi:hypothetical protein
VWHRTVAARQTAHLKQRDVATRIISEGERLKVRRPWRRAVCFPEDNKCPSTASAITDATALPPASRHSKPRNKGIQNTAGQWLPSILGTETGIPTDCTFSVTSTLHFYLHLFHGKYVYLKMVLGPKHVAQ